MSQKSENESGAIGCRDFEGECVFETGIHLCVT